MLFRRSCAGLESSFSLSRLRYSLIALVPTGASVRSDGGAGCGVATRFAMWWLCQRRFWPCEHALQLAHMIRPPCRPLPTQHRCCRRRAGFPCLIVRPVPLMLTRGHCRLSRQEIKCFDVPGFLFENAPPSIGKKPAPSAGGCRTGSRPLGERMRPSALSSIPACTRRARREYQRGESGACDVLLLLQSNRHHRIDRDFAHRDRRRAQGVRNVKKEPGRITTDL
jgi:hypothetical protein